MARFKTMIIIGKPGCGKSELVDLLKKTPLPRRMLQFYVGDYVEMDDYLYLSEKGKEDNIWENIGLPRKFTKKTPDGVLVTDFQLCDFALEAINKEALAQIADQSFFNLNTLFIEFSRGCSKPYKDAISIFDDKLLEDACVLYIDISYEEALFRNQLRYKKEDGDSKLSHKVPLEIMESLYKTDDWKEITDNQPQGFITIRNKKIPFVTMRNQPMPRDDAEFEQRIMIAFHNLYSLKYGEEAKFSISERSLKKDNINTFGNLFVFGRPASGKSEFIDFIKKTNPSERIEKFNIGLLEELDDYVVLAQKFNEEEIWNKLNGKRKYTYMEEGNHIIEDLSLFNFAANRVAHIALNRFADNNEFYKDHTLFIEFSRGIDIGYKETLDLFNPKIFKKSAIIYIKTSFDECWRRNVARYQEKKKFSILAHMVPWAQMKNFYFYDDWSKLTSDQEAGFLELKGIKVPFVTLDNESESKDPVILSARYKNSLDKLFNNFCKTQSAHMSD